MIKVIWLAQFLGLLLLLGCEKPVYHNIPDNEKIKLKSDDTLVFTDGANADTLLLFVSDDYRNSDKIYNYEQIYIHYSIVKNGIVSDIPWLFDIYQGYSGEISLSSGDDHFPFIEPKDLTYKENSFDLNGKTLNDVYHLVLDSNKIQDTTIITEIYYSYKYGVVKYKKVDGNFFGLQQ